MWIKSIPKAYWYFDIYKTLNITIKYHQGHDLIILIYISTQSPKSNINFFSIAISSIWEVKERRNSVGDDPRYMVLVYILSYSIRSNANRERLTLCRRHLIKQVIIFKPWHTPITYYYSETYLLDYLLKAIRQSFSLLW